MLAASAADNLDPQAYGVVQLKALIDQPGKAARFEASLSQALTTYLHDLHRPGQAAEMTYAAGAAPPSPPSARQLLEQAASAPDLGAWLRQARRMNPVYEGLRDVLAQSPQNPAARLNLERARALPADPGPRFILVDAAAQELWLYEDGRAVDSMKVVVGKPSMPTPIMAGHIQYAVLDPYWNVPIDLVRDTIAPEVLRDGPGVLARRRFEVLSDWSASAQPVDPGVVDWRAVAAGRYRLRVRQLPGADNMMGRVKFMLPNTLGIYLHDTPDKALFSARVRTFSSGCVRLEDAARLGAWLGAPLDRGGAADRRIDLATPVPIYITYFTAVAAGGGLERRADVYGRDAPVLADFQQRRQAAG
jgi:L,D-transpeptidase YcbB